jgi:hypothetical protein
MCFTCHVILNVPVLLVTLFRSSDPMTNIPDWHNASPGCTYRISNSTTKMIYNIANIPVNHTCDMTKYETHSFSSFSNLIFWIGIQCSFTSEYHNSRGTCHFHTQGIYSIRTECPNVHTEQTRPRWMNPGNIPAVVEYSMNLDHRIMLSTLTPCFHIGVGGTW